MESFFVRFKNPLILLVILLAQTIGLAVQVRRPTAAIPGDTTGDSHSVSLVRYWVVSVVTPFERFFHGIGSSVYYGWSNYIDLRHIRRQNEALKQQLADMRIQQAAIAQDAIQGHRLQALLDFQQHYVAKTVAAQVIGTSGSDLSRILYIDKGREEGLKPDQAVITPDGIVGKLRDVFPHSAQVLLIDDQTSGAGVLLSSSRIRAIVHGASGARVVISNLTPDSRIKPGEIVLTSGGDQVFPRGLPVGTIESIAPDLDHQPYTIIRVAPAAKLWQLEEVLIITGTQPQLPAQARQDLAVGAATAEAQATAAAAHAAEVKAAEDAKSAAEIVADRLPSLHDPNSPDAAKPDAKPDPTLPPGGKVPKPLPTLHPDRYTPGSTPSAAELTPGSANRNNASRPISSPAAPTVDSDTPRPAAKKPQPKSTPPAEAAPNN